MQDDLAGLIERIDFYVTNVGHSLCAEASRALKALTRENAELVTERNELLRDYRRLVNERDAALAEVEQMKLRAAEDRLTIADLAGARDEARTQLTATQARLNEAVEVVQAVIDHKASTFRARNGREVGIQGDDGEKCYIVHSDQIAALEAFLDQQEGR